ncbi:metal-dependent transcriptional regulator [Corynebacterium spheniscorum]|uniref:Iron (Metal) dependent repressor, DtxR family n=1 Tax=Corynebacterium spheniscorum TaxID=185761 RepID=A0A1I2PRY5_9CORY|nr:metal-dependent transcriptional regulator [Corynebacterium spheniscorum]SFG18380.1 iron (metal) dependent repressor, DtxR family [Corynebacterium spheniscorum]
MASRGLVIHEPYTGATLTDAGRAVAMEMVRRHRLVEMFLVEVLDYRWDEVHAEADMLEHAVSDRLLHRIDTYLGNPTRDPHGDPIPDARGQIDDLGTVHLGMAEVGDKVIVLRIHDSNAGLLRKLARYQVCPGSQLIVEEARCDCAHNFRTPLGQSMSLDAEDLELITVKVEEA